DELEPDLALVDYQVVAKCGDVFEQGVGAVRDDLAPARLRWVGGWRLHELEVFRAAVIGADQKAVTLVLDVVFQPVLARVDYLERVGRLIGGQVADLTGSMAADRKQHIPAALAAV